MKWFKALLVGWICCLFGVEPDALYLTWTRDPMSSITVVWHTKAGETDSEVYLHDGEWRLVKGWVRKVEEADLWVHIAELEGLREGMVYEFRVGRDGDLHQFRTLEKKGVVFAVGGDAYYHEEPFRAMNREIARQGVDFAVVGGDIAYTMGEKIFGGKSAQRWGEFFRMWKEDMVDSEGRMIPIVAVVGNHDVPRNASRDAMFFDMFPFPERDVAYRAMDIGAVSLFLLDTGHTNPIGGKQTAWLEGALQQRAHVPFKFAVYHVAAYPSYYKFEGKTPTEIRKYWAPLFELYGVRAVFEHHNHAYKRTAPIKGVVYLGDGSWGVPPRRVDASRPYLERAASVNGYWLVKVDENGCTMEPRKSDGSLIEEPVRLSN